MLTRALPAAVTTVLLVLAGAVLLHQPASTTAAGRITRAGAQEVCLRTAGHDVCLDRGHVDHLRLAGVRAGDCADVTWSGDLVVAASLRSVVPVSC
ncbi:hypothetical protein [Kineococcus sp. SYSU DK002]|uniref:hypothetical protein n=1 Tax=Kineococcus sp. SYSU DK002 TaxID=3383123 RepID=UPI003D7D116B